MIRGTFLEMCFLYNFKQPLNSVTVQLQAATQFGHNHPLLDAPAVRLYIINDKRDLS